MKEELKIKEKVKIFNPQNTKNFMEIELIVDTGATFSCIKKEKLEKLNIKPLYKRKFKTADGRIVERDVGACLFEIPKKGKTISEVIFGEKEDIEVLGLHTLEGMALTINTKTGELKPIELTF